MCVICRQRFPKSALRRFTLTSTGTLAYDAGHAMPGRGWYVCGQETCLRKFERYRPAVRHMGRNKNR
ncbi:MAG: YlxR family protein [Desulfovibrionaceae bacterium]|nr:YlxR family protein [Desulfovibrionaceae bacterium]